MYIKGRWYRDHTEILYEGVRFWNQWRKENPNIRPSLYRLTLSELDLRKAELSSANLSYSTFLNCDLRGAYLNTAYMNGTQFRDTDLADANLDGAYLEYADFSGANLKGASLSSLHGAWMSNFSRADLSEADLRNANLATVNLSGARLCSANLEGANLVETNLEGADLSGSDVYGVSAWNVQTDDETNQAQLHVRGGRYGEPIEAGFTVDGLELAQFVNLLLNNKNIRRAIDTITSKVVLLLGRFTSDRKAVLDDLRDALRQHDYVPIMFDFPEPRNRDLDETVSILAYLARFVIADLTDPRSAPHELRAIIPNLKVPVQPILLEGTQSEYGMFSSLQRYPWVLPTYRYKDRASLLRNVESQVISPAEAKASEIAKGF